MKAMLDRPYFIDDILARLASADLEHLWSPEKLFFCLRILH